MGLLDRYEIVRHLGRGASGDVYLARDRQRGGREVALKTIAVHVDDLLRAAFEREFSTMAAVSLPGIAQVHDFGLLPDPNGGAPRPFFTRTYIEGEPLDVAAAKVPLDTRLQLFMAMGRVLAPLHRAGVVHGDIKPGNAIIDAEGHAWLIDFGLARTQSADARARDAMGPAGTPPYMAPELLRGERASVAADIYALGATLWRLVTGEHPYEALGARGIAHKLEGKLPALPVTLTEPGRQALVVASRALAHDPLDRYPSVDEMLLALKHALQSESGAVQPRGASQPPSAASAFVPPPPRGHDELLATVEAWVQARGTGRSGNERIACVLGAAGSGKSLFLRELKWRLSLRGHAVVEVSGESTIAESPLCAVFERLLLALGETPVASEGRRVLAGVRSGAFEEQRVADALAALLAEASAQASVVLLVDDSELAEPVFGAVLRSAIHAQPDGKGLIIASAADATRGAARELRAERRFTLPTLSRDDVAALCHAALGAVDATVVDALVDYAQGLPGSLVNACAQLAVLPAVTAADVQKLPPSAAGIALLRVRLAAVHEEGLAVLRALSLIAAVPSAVMVALVRAVVPGADAAALAAQLFAQSILVRVGENVGFADGALRKALVSTLDSESRRALATRLLLAPELGALDIVTRAQLAVAAEDAARVASLAPEAARWLSARGSRATACELWEAARPHLRGEALRQAQLECARDRIALGEDETALRLVRELQSDAQATTAERAEAAVLEGRALTALGRFDEAVAALGRAPADADAKLTARVQRDLAKVHLRRGDYAAVDAAVDAGLASAAPDDAVRSELLCSRGMVASYRSEHDAARAAHEEALAVARAHGDKRDQANALVYLAIGCQRSGDMAGARDLLAQSLEIARELGDVGSMATYSMNLGAVLWYLGDPAGAAEHYQSAGRLALRAGRAATYAQARNNLAHVHIYFGLYELAKEEVAQVLAEAEGAGQRFIAAQCTALAADLQARLGQVDRALIGYDDAIARYTQLGQTREVAEHHLDAAEALLDRGGPVDASAAAARLATARELVEREKVEDLRLRMELLVARARLANGDAEGARQTLASVLERARAKRDADTEWSALTALASAHELAGAMFAAQREARLAVEVLETIALRVPKEHREAFWHDPRRRAARDRVVALEERPSGGRERSEPQTVMLGTQVEQQRLLEIIKRLASEHELDRLLERITESAVDLSGAQRGSVMLVDPAGQLMPHVTRVRASAEEEAHSAFSRSIAEAVLIDGEPIITVDATIDGRLREYASVHKLMLRSVACLPIRVPSGTVGVLYLEHRRSRGRFDEHSVELLSAFADQAAIAIENARLLAEVRRQKAELEAKNVELARAKDELEEALLARTRQLDDVQRELLRATRGDGDVVRHGIVGKSVAMKRVLDAIERLADTAVPVVLRGESGTGKELVARAIHYSGVRAKAPFVAINCGALPENLLESELFGHVRGAFSGADRDKRGMIASASGGTLFLDEVSDMPARMQVDLLRVLQEGKVRRVGSDMEEPIDVRVVTATQRPLADLVAEGKFREDLMYRLNVVEVPLPALRERADDIPALCEHFLRLFAEQRGLPRRHVTRAALGRLMLEPWPGNVRQLEHVLLQASVMVSGSTIDVDGLSLGPTRAAASTASSASDTAAQAVRVESLGDYKVEEKQRILDALQACGWNRAKAAQVLGMPRRTFYRRLTDYAILS